MRVCEAHGRSVAAELRDTAARRGATRLDSECADPLRQVVEQTCVDGGTIIDAPPSVLSHLPKLGSGLPDSRVARVGARPGPRDLARHGFCCTGGGAEWSRAAVRPRDRGRRGGRLPHGSARRRRTRRGRSPPRRVCPVPMADRRSRRPRRLARGGVAQRRRRDIAGRHPRRSLPRAASDRRRRHGCGLCRDRSRARSVGRTQGRAPPRAGQQHARAGRVRGSGDGSGLAPERDVGVRDRRVRRRDLRRDGAGRRRHDDRVAGLAANGPRGRERVRGRRRRAGRGTRRGSVPRRRQARQHARRQRRTRADLGLRTGGVRARRPGVRAARHAGVHGPRTIARRPDQPRERSVRAVPFAAAGARGGQWSRAPSHARRDRSRARGRSKRPPPIDGGAAGGASRCDGARTAGPRGAGGWPRPRGPRRGRALPRRSSACRAGRVRCGRVGLGR